MKKEEKEKTAVKNQWKEVTRNTKTLSGHMF